MHKLYAVAAVVSVTRLGYAGAVQLPIFHLDADIHGILSSEDAMRIGRKIVDPLNQYDNVDLCAYLIGG